MAADLPDVPENIGQEWTNPETGIVYEWNGKRWVAKPNEISLDDVAHLSNTQTFTGSNTFENKTYFKSGDDSHRLYMKDKDNTTNLTIFPTGKKLLESASIKSFFMRSFLSRVPLIRDSQNPILVRPETTGQGLVYSLNPCLRTETQQQV